MVRIADARLASTFLKVAFIVSVEGCRVKIKSFQTCDRSYTEAGNVAARPNLCWAAFGFNTQLFQISKKPVLHPSGQNLTKARP